MTLEAILKSVSPAEARAIFQALDQYVENGHCNNEVEDPYEDVHLRPAEAILDRLSAYFAQLT